MTKMVMHPNTTHSQIILEPNREFHLNHFPELNLLGIIKTTATIAKLMNSVYIIVSLLPLHHSQSFEQRS
jgi:hypothetical protein